MTEVLFKAGDVVELKGGSVPMTVNKSFETSLGVKVVACDWFLDSELQKATFPADSIVKSDIDLSVGEVPVFKNENEIFKFAQNYQIRTGHNLQVIEMYEAEYLEVVANLKKDRHSAAFIGQPLDILMKSKTLTISFSPMLIIENIGPKPFTRDEASKLFIEKNPPDPTIEAVLTEIKRYVAFGGISFDFRSYSCAYEIQCKLRELGYTVWCDPNKTSYGLYTLSVSWS